MSFVVIIGALFALWIYRDAKKHGYSKKIAVAWALGSIFAPYITVPLYWVFGRKFQIKTREKQADAAGGIIEGEAVFAGVMIDCPMCGGKVQEDFNNCPRCGYSLKLVCAKCGQDLERIWKICPYCQQPAPEK